MKRLLIVFLLFGVVHGTTLADDGLVSVKSAKNVPTTADRLVALIEEKGMKVFARIDHAAGAAKVRMSLEPTELVIFGNPKVGTPLMKCGRGIAIDLPMKMLIWEDGDGRTWLSYNDPAFLAERHALEGCDEVLGKVQNALAGLAKTAAE